MSLLDTASLVITPNGTKAGTLYSVVPSSGAGDMTVTRATTSTRVNSAGLIESVASNVPRLDYSNGTCPSILVEPQRTNISQFVESGTGGFQAGTITAGTSILGLTTFKVTTNVSLFGDAPYIDSNTQYQANTAYTLSFYTDFSKTDDTLISCSFLAFFPTLGYTGIRVDKATKAITTFNVGGVWTLNSYEAKQIDGEIYRIIATATPNATGLGASRNYISTDNNGKFAEFAGVQLEAGSYATSFISKVSSASVTRNADVISKTGISSLIGQTEGTMFVDIDFDGTGYGTTQDFLLYIGGGSYTNSIWIDYYNNNFRFYIYSGTTNPFVFTTPATNGRKKLAFGYKSGQYVAYINGTLVNSSTDTTAPPTCSMVSISEVISNDRLTKNFNNVALWKTRLTNTQLQTLTSL